MTSSQKLHKHQTALKLAIKYAELCRAEGRRRERFFFALQTREQTFNAGDSNLFLCSNGNHRFWVRNAQLRAQTSNAIDGLSTSSIASITI